MSRSEISIRLEDLDVVVLVSVMLSSDRCSTSLARRFPPSSRIDQFDHQVFFFSVVRDWFTPSSVELVVVGLVLSWDHLTHHISLASPSTIL